MRTKPCAYETILMWLNNKTSAWLASLSEMEKKAILENARQNVPDM